MHRVYWDLRYQPFPVADVTTAGNVTATGAVPGRTYPAAAAPWAAPGGYTVRLTAGGRTSVQPLTLRLDPRVRTPAVALARLATLSRSTYDAAMATRIAYTDARALSARLGGGGAEAQALKARIDSLAPVPPAGGGGFGGGFGGGQPQAPPNLLTASNALMASAMAMQGADVAPTRGQVAATERARAQAAPLLTQWSALKARAASLLGTP
jgi:hypothetical protein